MQQFQTDKGTYSEVQANVSFSADLFSTTPCYGQQTLGLLHLYQSGFFHIINQASGLQITKDTVNVNA